MVIDNEDIDRATRVLQVVYDNPSLDRQLENMRVDQVALDRLVSETTDKIKSRYRSAWYDMDPRMEPAFNTALYHAFMVGLLAGRGETARIE